MTNHYTGDLLEQEDQRKQKEQVQEGRTQESAKE